MSQSSSFCISRGLVSSGQTVLPGHARQGLDHVLAGVGADLGEHDVALLQTAPRQNQSAVRGGLTVVSLFIREHSRWPAARRL